MKGKKEESRLGVFGNSQLVSIRLHIGFRTGFRYSEELGVPVLKCRI